ncbi:MAG: YifB family Mg chelatase-like AAA ATPase [Lachnospiraceae bacterium]|nr:YifB family Mg chelatase-like AAA ATPase [Lachnospiraceae bacterium]
MFSKTYAAAIRGVDALLVQVEADISDGLPGLELVGFLASELREAKERVRVAIHNAGIVLPPKKITVNLSPADVRKEGTAFDLAIAVAILTASGHLSEEYIKQTMFVGELSLDGRLNPVNGILPIACCAKECGLVQLVVPAKNRAEAMVTGSLDVWGCETLRQVMELLLGNPPDGIPEEEKKEAAAAGLPDFSEICGQQAAKRAIEIAVSGGHNLLFLGSPGSGKTMLAKRIPSIMPELTFEESLELSKIYSVSGKLAAGGTLMKNRPFQAPHHSITVSAMAGGGRNPKPGQISLATHGVLFLDELPEFERRTIELLRQPLEERKITVNRVAESCDYPAAFMFVAAMNPCPCGAYPDRKHCRCSEPQIRKYQSKISRAILDRIDLFLQVAPVAYEELQQKGQGECSAAIRARVTKTRRIQQERYAGLSVRTNAELSAKQLTQFCILPPEGEALLKEAFFRYGLSARAYHRIIRVARTIADMEGAEQIGTKHLCEAIGYRREV